LNESAVYVIQRCSRSRYRGGKSYHTTALGPVDDLSDADAIKRGDRGIRTACRHAANQIVAITSSAANTVLTTRLP
jgi:hypothetical protein